MPDIFENLREQMSEQQARELDTLYRGFNLLNSVIDNNDVRRALRAKHPENTAIPQPIDELAKPFVEPIQAQIDELKTAVPAQRDELLKELDERKTAIEKVVDDFKKERADETAVSDLKQRIDKAVKHYRFTDEGREALITHMKDTSTSDPMTAGAFLVQNMERPAPTVDSGLAPDTARRNGAPDVDLFKLATGHDDESLKLLHGSPKEQTRWMENEINKVIQEGLGQEAA